MFIHKNTEYSIGHSLGKYSISIPRLKYFKEYKMKQDAKNFDRVHQIARDLINKRN